MPYSIDILSISGGTPPISLFACDEFGNNCTFLGTTAGTYVLPALLQTATTIMVKTVDSTGCIYFKLLTCEEEGFFVLTELGDILTTEDGDSIVWF